jgi:hypothetical protein
VDATPPTPSSSDKVVEIPAIPAKKFPLPQRKKRQKRRLKQREEEAAAAHVVAAQAVLVARRRRSKIMSWSRKRRGKSPRSSQNSGTFWPPRSQLPMQYGYLPRNGPGVGATHFSPSPRSDSPDVAESFLPVGQAVAGDLNAPLEDSSAMRRAHAPRRTLEGVRLIWMI